MPKIKTFIKFLPAILLFCYLLTTVFISATTYAADCGGVKTAIIACDTKGTNNGLWSILLMTINLMAAGIGIVAVGGILYASILYATARDDTTQVANAIKMIINIIIGIVSFGLLYSFLQFLIPGGFMQSLLNPPTIPKPTAPVVTSVGATGNSPAGGACYNVTSETGAQIQGKMYHLSGAKGQKALENSVQGVQDAASHGYKSIDIDTQVTKDGVIVATHWSMPLLRDGFYDPEGQIGKNTRVDQMTYAQVSRLKNTYGPYQIISLADMINVLASNNMNLSFELKAPNASRSLLPQVASELNAAGVKAYVKGAISIPGMDNALGYARQLGFWTRGTLGSQGWKKPAKNSNLCKQLGG